MKVYVKSKLTWHFGYYLCKYAAKLHYVWLVRIIRIINPKIFTLQIGKTSPIVKYLKDLDIE
jgi:hypothetical protein